MKQLSVFVENKPGILLRITDIFEKNNINLSAITIAETQDFGIARMIVDKINDAETLLKSQGFSCTQTDIVAVEVPDKPGGLSDILRLFDAEKINIEYMYGFQERQNDCAIMVFRIKESDAAKAVLQKNGIHIFSKKTI
ncbi:MAG: ACT domain-containing protein [Lactobacillales bacterium]|jgi:hypothetical protein|nr:ACT domain-containing protein [Lactobacillales bacterium]